MLIRGSWGVKRVSKVTEGDEKILGVWGKHRRVVNGPLGIAKI